MTLLSILISLLFSVATASYSVTGTVVDASDGSPVVAADILVTDLDDKVISYGVSDSQGRFRVGNIGQDEILVLVKMMGYDTYVSDKLHSPSSGVLDIGEIRMSRSTTGLQEVTVVGEKNRIVYKLDRQQISGSSSVTSAGGTAVDILSGLPSVLVDSEGNLSFRGSTRFLVYVDGKPSPLEGTSALQQIPAASVEDIEILTTPSARYRTDGDHIEIGRVMVDQDFRNRGIASELLTAVEELSQEKVFELYTCTKSYKNINLYEKLGYKIYKTEKGERDLSFAYMRKTLQSRGD